MKKLLVAVILGFLAVGLLLPGSAVLAQIGDANLNECCKINAKFNAFSVTMGGVDTPLQFDNKAPYPCIVGAKGGSCVLNGVDYSGQLASYTTFIPQNVKCGDDPAAVGSEYIVMDGWGIVCLLNTVYSTTNWIFYLMMVAVVIVFVAAGAMFMMAGGDTGKTKTAKGMMILGVVGLVIALVAKLIPSVVKMIVGM